MRKGILGSLTALLAGTSLALADPPAASDSAAVAQNSTGQPSAVLPNPSAAPLDQPRSPYWPDPLGKLQCIGPSCLTPAAPHEEGGHAGQLAVWGSAEYLLWWVRNQPLATPLVTTGTTASMGALGNAGTTVLFGGSDIDYHTFSGARFTLGLGWGSCDDGIWGIEGSGFFLEKRIANFVATSSVTGVPILARPFQNAVNALETEALVSFPGAAQGSVDVSSGTSLYGWDVDLVAAGLRNGDWKVGLLGGFRYLNLSEDLDITQNSSLLPGGVAGFGFANALVPPTTVTILDRFGTRNEFYGGQLGARVEFGGEHLFVSALGKIALGSVHEVVDLAGFTSGTALGRSAGTTAGGLLVVSSNAGRRAHDEFAAVPEIGINVGYQVCHAFRVFVGYDFLYISDVVRPGDQINRVVNPALIPASTSFGRGGGPAQPTFSFQRTDFWAQGMNVGFEFRF